MTVLNAKWLSCLISLSQWHLLAETQADGKAIQVFERLMTTQPNEPRFRHGLAVVQLGNAVKWKHNSMLWYT
jgi:Flp pilus assembly protein TadD